MKYFPYLILGSIALTLLSAAPSWAMSAAEVARVAKSNLVRIDNGEAAGSGVLIRQERNTYTVLTAAHVLRSLNEKAEIITVEDTKYRLDRSQVMTIAGADLAIATFRSEKSYRVAKLGNPVNASEGNSVYVAGFPVGTEAIDARIFNFTDGKVTANSSKLLKDGYSIIYSNSTLPGMSGGGVFNDKGELIAIHGKGDVDTKINISNINPDVRIKTGFNLGIAIDTFARLAVKAGINIGPQPALVAATTKQRSKADESIVSGFDKVSKNNIPGAIADFTNAVKLNPNSKVANFWLGTCKLIIGDRQNAINDLTKAIALNPQRAESYIYRGFAYVKTNEKNRAIADLDTAVKLSPNSDFSYGNRCTLKFQLRDYNGAIADCNRAIKFNPTNYFHYVSRGATYYQLDRYPLALKDYETTVTLSPKDAINYLNRGMTKIKLKDNSSALTDLERSIALDRNLPTSYYYRGILRAESGKKQTAIADFQTAAKLYRARQDKAGESAANRQIKGLQPN
jgi:tetratricopeptide (TPR) repeat protein